MIILLHDINGHLIFQYFKILEGARETTICKYNVRKWVEDVNNNWIG